MRTAVFSEDRKHRFRLTIPADNFGRGSCAFVMLNPSTADEHVDDPTVRRCINYAIRWGFHDVEILNIFAYRSTDPSALYMLEREEAIGLHNNIHILNGCRGASVVVCAWGAHGRLWGRGSEVCAWLAKNSIDPRVLKYTKGGEPSHPLYLKADLNPRLMYG
jgi:hypothetical protein